VCEFFIIVFVIEVRIWTFHFWLLNSIIYYVAPSGHQEKWCIKFETKKTKVITNNIFKSIDIVAIVGLAWGPFFEFQIFEFLCH